MTATATTTLSARAGAAGMSNALRATLMFSLMGLLLALVGFGQSWSLALAIVNLCVISAIMSLGVNIQWGYAGLFNAGVMGFAALGGIAAVLVSKPPVPEAWSAGGPKLAVALFVVIVTAFVATRVHRAMAGSRWQTLGVGLVVLAGVIAFRWWFDPAVAAIESFEPARFGYLGGLGAPIVLSWLVGGAFAAGAAWLVARIALGLRSDYLAIATLGISEIVIAMIKNEDWLTRGVKNVTGLPRPVPFEIELQQTPWFIDAVAWWYSARLDGLVDVERLRVLEPLVVDASGNFVKLAYLALFMIVLVILFWLCERALRSPWGRMMRAIRDNESAAAAMGKDVVRRHRQTFILGSAVIGVAGAMLTTLDGQFTPGSYNPLRFTFLVWVMVIVGGSGNNLGAILGGFLIWFVWIQAEPAGLWAMNLITSGMGPDSALQAHLLDAAPHMRLILMGLLLLVVMRFSPKGLLPEVVRR